MAQHNELGFWGEDQAAEYLRNHGDGSLIHF